MAYVGDGNNMTHSLMYGAAKLGAEIRVACPNGYKPDPAVVATAKDDAAASGGKIVETDDPAVRLSPART